MKNLFLVLLFLPLVSFGQTKNDIINGYKIFVPDDFVLAGKLFWENKNTGETVRINSSEIPTKYLVKDFYDKVISYDSKYIEETISYDFKGDNWKFNKYFEYKIVDSNIHNSLFISNDFNNNGDVKMICGYVLNDKLFLTFITGNLKNDNGTLSNESAKNGTKRLGFIFGQILTSFQ